MKKDILPKNSLRDKMADYKKEFVFLISLLFWNTISFKNPN